jgi:hypothetical protein
MPVVEAAAQAGAMKLAATKVAHACAPKSSQGAAANVAAAKSTAHMAASESAATAHVAASESAATAAPGGHGVRPGCRAECDDSEEDDGPACDGLLPDAGR